MRKRFVISACIGGAVAFMLISYFFKPLSNKEVLTLYPDEGQAKVKPSDPGGVIIPYSDNLVYNKLRSKDAKLDGIHFLPDPEKPIEIVRNTIESQPQFLDSIDEILANIEHYETELVEGDLDDNDASDYIMPNMLTAKDSEPDNSEACNEVIFVAGAKLQVIKALEDRYQLSRNNVVSKGEQGYKIQLSSASSEADANKQWRRIRKKHSKILQDTHLIIKKVEGKNERIFFLIMAGTYPSLNQAKRVCKHLSYKKQNCIVTK